MKKRKEYKLVWIADLSKKKLKYQQQQVFEKDK